MHRGRSYHNEGRVHSGPVQDSKNYPDSPRARHSMRSSTWRWSSSKTRCSTHPSRKYVGASIVELRRSTGNPHDGTSGCHRERGRYRYPVNYCGTFQEIVPKSIVIMSDVQLNLGVHIPLANYWQQAGHQQPFFWRQIQRWYERRRSSRRMLEQGIDMLPLLEACVVRKVWHLQQQSQ